MSESESEIRVLSFNCWGLKFISKDRSQRFRAIADELANSTYDVICLQEVWVRADYEIIREKVSSTLPYAKVFYAGALGAGVAIFSRFPILETSSFSYSHNGEPHDVARGDWIVGKGLFSALISHPILYEVEIFNTHMNAGGGDEGLDEVKRISRLTAAWELSKRIRHSAALGRHVIVAGDFNSVPTSLVMTIVREHGHLTDAWAASHDQSFLPEAAEVHTPHHALREFGVTADSPLNSYTAHKKLDGIAARWQGKRLDYILYRGPARVHRRWRKHLENGGGSVSNGTTTNGTAYFDDSPVLHCTTSKVVLTGKVPGQSISFSDHFGVEANLSIRYPSPSQIPLPPAAPSVWNTAASSSISTFTSPTPGGQQPYLDSTSALAASTPPAHSTLANVADDQGLGDGYDITLSAETVSAMLGAIEGAYRQSKRRSRQYMTVFWLCVVALAALIVGSAWQPLAGANPVLVIVTGVITWWGTTMLYAGFIWGNWELNWLMTVVEELELLNRGRVTVTGR